VIERVRAGCTPVPRAARGIGSLFIDTNRRDVLVDKQRAELTRSEFDVLVLLASARVDHRRSLAERVLAPPIETAASEP
jgi:DNA-binding response OmpR family regulator